MYKRYIIGFFILIVPFFVHATSLVNINTANVATLDSLPYISKVKAQNIVDYRNTNGVFNKIEDIENVDGIKSGVFSHIEDLITVGSVGSEESNTASISNSDTVNTFKSSTDKNVSTSQSRAEKYTPPPTSLFVSIASPKTALVEVPIIFKASVQTNNGAKDSSVHVRWSFGDGSSSEGRVVSKLYHYVGTYRVVAIASDGSVSARSEVTVSVKHSHVRISAISGEGITLSNDTNTELDLSNWRITSSGGVFRIPEGMTILATSSVLIPFNVMNLPIVFDAVLTYPDGVIVAKYVQHVVKYIIKKPSSEALSFNRIQRKNTVGSSTARFVSIYNKSAHEEATAIAPVAPTKVGATGARVHSATSTISTSVVIPQTQSHHFIGKSWTIGLLSALAFAGATFILI